MNLTWTDPIILEIIKILYIERKFSYQIPKKYYKIQTPGDHRKQVDQKNKMENSKIPAL